MLKKLLLPPLIAIVASLLLVSPALAAQGQITEVNPSGVHGVIVEDGTGDEVGFVRPASMQDPEDPWQVGDPVTYETSTTPGGQVLPLQVDPPGQLHRNELQAGSG